jgi:hypothetical protein
MVGHLAGKRAGERVDHEYTGEKVRELERLRGKPANAREHCGVVGEELGVMRPDHAAARTRRGDQVVAVLEFGDDLARERDGVRAIARVVRRLTAACLCFGHDDVGAARFQQLQCRKADRRSHQIDQTGYEESDAHESPEWA